MVLAVSKACLLGSDEELKAETDKCTPDPGGPSKASSSGFPTVATLGQAPPTATLQDLQTIAKLRSVPPSLWHLIQEREDFKPIRKKVVDSIAPLKDLVKAMKERVNGMKVRKAALKEEKGNKFGDLSAPTVLHIFLCLSIAICLLRDQSICDSCVSRTIH